MVYIIFLYLQSEYKNVYFKVVEDKMLVIRGSEKKNICRNEWEDVIQ